MPHGIQTQNLTVTLNFIEVSRMIMSIGNVIDRLEGLMPTYPPDCHDDDVTDLRAVRATLKKAMAAG